MTFKESFAVVSQVSVLLPIVAGWVYYKKLNFPFRLLFYFFLSCLGFELLARGMRIYYNNNMPGLHLFSIVQLLAFSTIYYYHFSNNKTIQRLVLFNSIAAFIIAVLDTMIMDGILHSNTVSRSYDAASIILYTLLYFHQLFQQDTVQSKRYDPMFWISMAALMYFGNNLMYFMLRRYLLIEARGVENFSYFMYMILNIIAHFFYAYSFRCFSKWKTKS